MPDIKTLSDYLRTGRIDRRGFMRGAIAAGLTISAATGLADRVHAQTPQKGGRFRIGITGGATSDDLDPATTLDSYMINVSFGQLRNCLTEIAPDGSLVGEVAESWEGSEDATEWVFKVRKGVEFHNGKTLMPEDVVASLNHHRGEDTKSAAKGIIAGITEVKADGDNVVVTLDGGNADLPYLMSDYHLVICPANDDGSIAWQNGEGCGAYMLESYDPGVRTLVKRNPNYWKSDRAYFDEVETLFISDPTARTSALQSGEVDAINNAELKTIHLLERADGINVLQTNGNQHCTLPMMSTEAPFDNNDLRLALKYAIDREEWLQKIFKGRGSLGNDHPVGPANQFQATPEEIEQRTYDPEKAKHHLKKAGHDSIDLKLHLAETAFPGAVDAGVLYSEAAAKAGINIEIVREPNDGYWSNVWLVKPWCGSYWGGRPTEDWIFSQIYSTGADWNEARWSNERFMELLKQGRATIDQDKRREIYVEMQRIVRDDGGSVIPTFLAYLDATSDKVATPEQRANNWELDGHRAAERWWFAG